MAKDAYYFPHDSNAKDDPKSVWLIEQLGLEGYGIYWVLIETLRDQPSYRYPIILISALARRYNTTAEKMKAVINGYGLFEVDENDFFSESLIKRMGYFEEKREKARKSVNARWEKQRQLSIPNDTNTNVIRTNYEKNTNVIQVKESKVKESKGNKIKVKDSKVKNNTYLHGADAPVPVDEDFFIRLPLNDKSLYPVVYTQINEWGELYPCVNVEQELKEMKGWLDSHPTRRKTLRGIKAFITNWLSREQDKGPPQNKSFSVPPGNPFKERLQKEIDNEQNRSNSGNGNYQSGIPKLLQGSRD